MVMEAPPSPQCVGREFVRQYYTLLNEAPQFLHRFYSNNSSFIHGGDAKSSEEEQSPVIGQSDIHKKIMSLEFKDCHAKIRYVDSQSTIATGVVVQVTGELSNNQAPLRRFMQTFVLAPQTPNKYYVHNDIFRYQDEVFADSDDEEEMPEGDPLEDVSGKRSPGIEVPLIETGHPDNNSAYQEHHQTAVLASMDHHHHHHSHVNGGTVMPGTEPIMANGRKEETMSPPPQPTQPEEPINRTPSPAAVDEPAAEVVSESAVGRVEVHPPSHQLPLASEEPMGSGDPPKQLSWANFVSKGGAVVPPTAPVVNAPQHNRLPTQTSESGGSPPEKQTQFNNRAQPVRNNRPGTTLGSSEQRGFGDAGAAGKPSRVDDAATSEERRPEKVKYPDSQQVFVGNLPANISEFELRDFFKAHGPVVEVRINRTSSHKLPFGFVVFDNEACAQKVLAFKSLEYANTKLNIEEKRPRGDSRPHSNSRQHGGRPRHMRGGGGGARGGFGGPNREDSGSRTDQGRFNNLNKSNQPRR